MQPQSPSRLASLRSLLRSLDPGWIRLENATRAVLAMLIAGLIIRVLLPVFVENPVPQVELFGFYGVFICSLTIADSQVTERKRTALLAFIPLSLALILASLFPIETQRLISYLILIALVFISFYLRRYGVRAAELTMTLTIGFYIANEVSPTLETLPQFIFAVIVAVAVYYLFQFVFIPYDPVRYVRRSSAAFYQQSAELVETMIRRLEITGTDTTAQPQMKRNLRQLHFSRQVIGRQLAALSSPLPERQSQIQALGLQLYNAESGLEIMVRGVGDLAHPETALPENMRQRLVQTLAALQSDLSIEVPPEQKTALVQASNSLQHDARAEIASGESFPWLIPLLQVVAAREQVEQAVEQTRALVRSTSASASTPAPKSTSAKPAAPRPPTPQSIPVTVPGIGIVHLYPTIILGIQAVTAVGIAMLVSSVLHLINPNWAYWTAFVVVVGSAGETLQKINRRVLGTLFGGFIAAFLLFIPGIESIIPLLIILSVFMSIFLIAINYAYFVFFITIMVMLLDGGLGGESGVIIERTLNVLIGAGVASVVARYVMPIHISDRLKVAMAHYLGAADQYLTALIGQPAKQTPSPDLDAQKMKVADSFDALAQTFPSAVFEENPLSRVQNSLANQTAAITVLNNYIDRLTDLAESDALTNTDDETQVVQSVQAYIHDNTQALVAFLTGKEAAPLRSHLQQSAPTTARMIGQTLAQNDDESADAEKRAVFLLSHINNTVIQLGDEFGATIESQPEQPAAT